MKKNEEEVVCLGMHNFQKNDNDNFEVYMQMQNSVHENMQNEINFCSFKYFDPILSLIGNGDIFVKGKLIENDIEVVNALREFILISQQNQKEK